VKLSPKEHLFLKHWLFEQFHYESGPGPAKQLQLEHSAIPAELSILIAVAIADPRDQKTAAVGPPTADAPKWPWNEEEFHVRLAEARAALAS
jgi:hypothetical protein